MSLRHWVEHSLVHIRTQHEQTLQEAAHTQSLGDPGEAMSLLRLATREDDQHGVRHTPQNVIAAIHQSV